MSKKSRDSAVTQKGRPAGAEPGVLQRNLLLGIVFLTGAAVLIVEVTATRILAPYFGNTMYTFSSVLSVILGALSCGYYFGGRLADKYPRPGLFYTIIAASGLCVLLVQLLIMT